MTPPQLCDGEGWPFRLLYRLPNRPDSFHDWQDGIREILGSSASSLAGLRLLHAQEVRHD